LDLLRIRCAHQVVQHYPPQIEKKTELEHISPDNIRAWSKDACNESKMADGRHNGELKHRDNSRNALTYFSEIW